MLLFQHPLIYLSVAFVDTHMLTKFIVYSAILCEQNYAFFHHARICSCIYCDCMLLCNEMWKNSQRLISAKNKFLAYICLLSFRVLLKPSNARNVFYVYNVYYARTYTRIYAYMCIARNSKGLRIYKSR